MTDKSYCKIQHLKMTDLGISKLVKSLVCLYVASDGFSAVCIIKKTM